MAVPTIGDLDADLAAFLLEAQRKGCMVRIFNGYKPIPYARNVITTAFLASESSRLWMIDSDMVPRANTWGVLDVDADIASALYPEGRFAVRDGGPRVRMSAQRYDDIEDVETFDEEFHPIPGDGVIDVSATGTGCMVIQRRVLEDRKLVLGEENGTAIFFRNEFSPSGRYIRGSDIDFCLRAKALGYEVKVDTDAFCGHKKVVDLSRLALISEFASGRLPAEAMGGPNYVRI